MPAPAGNRNGLTSGRQSIFTTGRYPKGASYIGRLQKQFKAALFAALERRGPRDGGVELFHDAAIDSACVHHGRRLILQRLLKQKYADLSVEQIVSLTREIGAACDARDKALKLLRLDELVQSVDARWAFLPDDGADIDAEPPAPPDSAAAATDSSPPQDQL